jgi:hypothetical protein
LRSTTTITSVTSHAVVGQALAIAVKVTGPTTTSGSPTPTGLVTVKSGRLRCEARLSGSNGVATGDCFVREAAVGTYEFTASYAGSGGFSASATLGSHSIKVQRADSIVVLKRSAGKAFYGHENTLRLIVNVSPEFGGAKPTGSVTVSESGNALCTITLSKGLGSCRLTSDELGVGSYRLVATYSGNADFHSSSSISRALAIESPSSLIIPGS